MLRRVSCCALGALVVLATPFAVYGANKTWTAAVSGDFGAAANWTGGVPGAADTATFNSAGTYTVTFDNNPNPLVNPVLNQDLFFQAGNVTFTSGSGGPYTYRLTGAGGDDALITGGTLSLGTSGNPLHLTVDDDLAVRGGSTLNVNFGSQVNTLDLLLATLNGGGNGTIVVDGTNSQLNVTNGFNLAQNGNTGTFTYRNSAQGTWSGTVSLGLSGIATTVAILNVESGADLNSGNLNVGNGSAAATGTVNIHGSGSTLVQGVASTLTVGTAAAGIGSINIGTITSGGTLTTGAGTLTINATGTVTIGSGANTGTLDANGDININGGLLERANATSTIDWASGRTMTIQNGGRFSIDGTYITATNAVYNISGSGSTLETIGSFPPSIVVNNGAAINVDSGGQLYAAHVLAVAKVGNGTINVDGPGSMLIADGDVANHLWGHGTNTATVSFSNNASGVIDGFLDLAGSGTGATANATIETGADLTAAGLGLADQGGTGTSATLNVQGSGSTFTQSGANPIIVGHASEGTAVINIGTTASGAEFTSQGTLTINATGEVNIGSGANLGTLNVNGNVTIDGGSLTRGNGSNFNLAPGATMTVQNGGSVSFTGHYTTTNDAIYNVTGASSILESLSGSLFVDNGAQVNVAAGGTVSANTIDIGLNGNGTLTVDGTGSSAAGSGFGSFWGGSGGTATVTFSNNATGTFPGGIALCPSSDAGTTADVDILSGADVSIGSLLSLADSGGATTSATLDVQGSGSTLTQTGPNFINVGHSSTGSATINIGTTASGAAFTTGTGTMFISATGTVNVGSGANTGTLNANGNVTIDGGVLQIGSGSLFLLDSGRTMTIQNGGTVSFTSGYAAANASYNISGAGSTLNTGDGLNISNIGGAVLNVSSQGSVSVGGNLRVGVGAAGTLVVDGSGSSASAGASQWGINGGTGNVTFSNGAAGSFLNGLSLATNSLPNSTAMVNIQSGADMATGNLTLANVGGATTSATLTIDGAGSTVTPGGIVTIGHAAEGSAIIYVLNGGALTVGASGSTLLNTTGTINIDGGSADLQSLTDNGGTINFAAGSLSYLGNLTVGTGGLLGENLTLTSSRQLTLDGTTTIDAGRSLTLDGGTFNTGALVINGAFSFIAGTLGVTGAGGLTIGSGGPLGGTLTLGAGRTVSVANTTTINSGSMLVMENGGGFTSGNVNNSGEIVLDGASATLVSAAVNNTGLLRGRGRVDALLNNQAGGEVRAATGELLQFIDPGSSVNSGRINLLGGTVEFTQSVLTNSASGQIMGHGSLIADSILNDGTIAFSGQADVLGDVTNDDGVIISSGGGPTTFFDDVVNDNEIRTSPGSFTVFFGSVSGAGSFTSTGTVNMEGDLSPGASPATVSFGGDLTFGTNGGLTIELGGPTLGSQFDHVQVDGAAMLDGTLDVSLIDGFVPFIGHSFEVLHADGGILGEFTDVSLPELIPGVEWNVVYSDFSVLLQVTQTLPGDFNLDGVVDTADFVVWSKGGLGVATTPEQYAVWRENFGESFGNGSGGDVAGQSAAPEPGSATLVLLGMILGQSWLRRKQSSPQSFLG